MKQPNTDVLNINLYSGFVLSFHIIPSIKLSLKYFWILSPTIQQKDHFRTRCLKGWKMFPNSCSKHKRLLQGRPGPRNGPPCAGPLEMRLMEFMVTLKLPRSSFLSLTICLLQRLLSLLHTALLQQKKVFAEEHEELLGYAHNALQKLEKKKISIPSDNLCTVVSCTLCSFFCAESL